MDTKGNRFALISGLVALAANIVTIFTAVGGFSGSLSFESPKLSEPMAFLMLLVLTDLCIKKRTSGNELA